MQSLIKHLLYTLLSINIVYVLVGVLHYGVSSIDSVAIWLFKAKAFYLYDGFPTVFLQNQEYLYQHPHYPVGLPWIEYLFFKLLGEFNPQVVLFAYPVIYVLILLIAYKIFRNMRLSQNFALVFVYIYSMFSPLLAGAGRMHAGEADIIITLFGWIILYCMQYIFMYSQKVTAISWLMVVLIIIASQIKMEGLFLATSLLFLPHHRKIKIIQIVITSIPLLGWFVIQNRLNIAADFSFTIHSASDLVHRVFVISTGLFLEMIKINNWYLFWIVFWLSFIAFPKTKSWMSTSVIFTSILMFSAYIATYLTTSLDINAHFSSSIDRVLLQLSPFIYFIWLDRLQYPSDWLKTINTLRIKEFS